jgi:hypothetical protein
MIIMKILSPTGAREYFYELLGKGYIMNNIKMLPFKSRFYISVIFYYKLSYNEYKENVKARKTLKIS